MQYVYVLNKHGNPLMPCSPRKARLLLKQKKACVIRRTPFTVKLLYGSTGYKQPVTLGVDAGSKHIGIMSARAVSAMCGLALELSVFLLEQFGEEVQAVGMLFDKRVNVAHPFLFQNLVDRNQNARFFHFAKLMVNRSAKQPHCGRQTHVGIDQRRNGDAVLHHKVV